uniref:Translation initiation factor if-2 n=1 Tax=Solanum tuberosum TaxID=4113 RepID=M0ZZ58_SOLTU
MEDMKSVMSRIDKTGEGVYVQATTLGSLEALLEFLKTPGVSIPVSGIGIGPVHKKNVIKASVMLEKKKEYSTILAFDVKVTQGARELSDELGVKVFMADIIYHLFDQFKAYIDTIKEEKKKEVAEEAVLPCVLKIIPNCVFKKKDPIVLGVDVLKGIFRIEELELKKKQQETKAIETSRKAIPSMEKCKKQLMIANSDFMEKMEAFSSPVKGVKMSKAQQSSGDDRASHVSISRKEYGHQQVRKCCSSSAISLPQGAASWLVLAIPRNIASDESII